MYLLATVGLFFPNSQVESTTGLASSKGVVHIKSKNGVSENIKALKTKQPHTQFHGRKTNRMQEGRQRRALSNHGRQSYHNTCLPHAKPLVRQQVCWKFIGGKGVAF